MTRSLDFLPQYSGWLVALLLLGVGASYLAVRFAAGPAVALARNWKLAALRLALIAALLAVLANPVRVSKTGGVLVPADVLVLADASASMALDDAGAPRWEQAVALMRSALPDDEQVQANVRFFKFGRQLQALPRSQVLADETLEAANEPDSQLLAALRQLTSRFGQRPPAGVVVLSDGRGRDADSAGEVAAHFGKLGVPIHVIPLGSDAAQGDVSVISLIAPTTIRKHSSVEVDVFLRSYGFVNRTAQLELSSIEADGTVTKKLASMPLVLSDGFQSVTMTFNSDESLAALRARVTPLPEEAAVENNHGDADVQIDQSKLRLLYLEGSGFALRPELRNNRVVMAGPHSPLRDALQADPDVECRVLLSGGPRMLNNEGNLSAFPRTASELFSYDAIIFSNVPRSVLTDEQLGWMEEWVETRGGGLCMVGGPQSYGDGGWADSSVGRMLPLEVPEQATWFDDRRITWQAVLDDPPHPLFRLLEDRSRNRQLFESVPAIRGLHAGLVVRPALATVLASGVADGSLGGDTRLVGRLFGRRSSGEGDSDADADQPFPAIVAGRYGRGRTLALTFPITAPAAESWHAWGGSAEHYGRFWRNLAYWLTDNSFIGRRRLSARADKQYYEPADTIQISVEAYDDSARATTDYRLVAIVEPQSLNIDSDYAPLRWPSGVERTSGEEGPLVMWGEEFEIPVHASPDGQPHYALDMQLAEASAIGQSSGARLEITAYDDDAQVDSTTLPIQVLHDPFEQQSPFPNHDLLKELAAGSGGTVIRNADELVTLLRSAPVTSRPPEIHKSPAWSTWWALACLLGLISAEWCWRRRIGLA
jgi:hypothetical protein